MYFKKTDSMIFCAEKKRGWSVCHFSSCPFSLKWSWTFAFLEPLGIFPTLFSTSKTIERICSRMHTSQFSEPFCMQPVQSSGSQWVDLRQLLISSDLHVLLAGPSLWGETLLLKTVTTAAEHLCPVWRFQRALEHLSCSAMGHVFFDQPFATDLELSGCPHHHLLVLTPDALWHPVEHS